MRIGSVDQAATLEQVANSDTCSGWNNKQMATG